MTVEGERLTVARRAKTRLDAALVARALAPSREKAARLILAGAVRVDGRRVDKAGALVAPAAASRSPLHPDS